MRIRLFAPLIVFAILPTSGPLPRPVLGDRPAMTLTPVALDPDDPARRTVGALTYLGGVRLDSRDPAFGGFSAMLVRGDRFTLLSDAGNIVRFRMDAQWRVRDLSFGDLPDGPGTGRMKRDRDSESMTADPAGRHIWIGFENANAIWRYDARLGRAERHVVPPVMADWEFNSGPEAMARLSDGKFVVLAEVPTAGQKARPGVMFSGDPTRGPRRGFRFGYMPPKGFSPTDIAELPDGRLIVLNRRASIPELFTAKLVLIERADIRRGATVSGREIAAFVPPLTRDNFEAMAVTREGRATILWLASDDNAGWPQQSLLLKFRLDPPERADAKP